MCRKFPDASDGVIEKQGLAIFDRRAQAFSTSFFYDRESKGLQAGTTLRVPDRNRIFLGGHRQGARRL
jgi:hypothetical protein